MSWHGYIMVSHLPPGWTREERDIAWQALGSMGNQSGDKPQHITHSCTSADGDAIILESLWQEDELTQEGVVNTIAVILDVNPTAVDARIDYEILAEGGTHEQSRQAAKAVKEGNPYKWRHVDPEPIVEDEP